MEVKMFCCRRATPWWSRDKFSIIFQKNSIVASHCCDAFVAAWQVMMPADKAVAQAVPAGELPPGEGNPADQVLPGQSLGSNLSLNQGVNAINAENQSFDRFGLGLSASGGEQTNFLGTQTNQQTASYAQFMADGGVLLRSEQNPLFSLVPAAIQRVSELFAVEQFFPDRVPEHDPHPDGAIGDRVGHNRRHVI